VHGSAHLAACSTHCLVAKMVIIIIKIFWSRQRVAVAVAVPAAVAAAVAVAVAVAIEAFERMFDASNDDDHNY